MAGLPEFTAGRPLNLLPSTFLRVETQKLLFPASANTALVIRLAVWRLTACLIRVVPYINKMGVRGT